MAITESQLELLDTILLDLRGVLVAEPLALLYEEYITGHIVSNLLRSGRTIVHNSLVNGKRSHLSQPGENVLNAERQAIRPPSADAVIDESYVNDLVIDQPYTTIELKVRPNYGKKDALMPTKHLKDLEHLRNNRTHAYLFVAEEEAYKRQRGEILGAGGPAATRLFGDEFPPFDALPFKDGVREYDVTYKHADGEIALKARGLMVLSAFQANKPPSTDRVDQRRAAVYLYKP